MANVLLVQGNAVRLPLRDGCAQMVCTSVPYYQLRDYGTATWVGGDAACTHSPADTPGKRGVASSTLSGGKQTTAHQREGYQGTCKRCGAERVDQQLGLEALHDCLAWARSEPPCETPCYICQMRRVFAECFRVLRNDGVMFVNIADSYNAAGRTGHGTRIGYKQGTNRASATGADACRPSAPGLKEKSLCGIPQRLALALQSDGWYWRSEIIWHKLNPMPESVTDRPTKAHEQVFLFAKQPHYFIDMEAIREPNEGDGRKRGHQTLTPKVALDRTTGVRNNSSWYAGKVYDVTPDNHRHARDVWAFCSEGFAGSHFATMPTALVSRCVLAGSSTHCCPQCHTPYQRQTEHIGYAKGCNGPGEQHYHTHAKGRHGASSTFTTGLVAQNRTTGFAPGCQCITQALADGCRDPQHMDWLTTPVPSIVLDPFSGSGTTVLTARALGRHGVGVELSFEYLRLSRERLGLAALDRWHGTMDSTPVATTYEGLPLFTVPEVSR